MWKVLSWSDYEAKRFRVPLEGKRFTDLSLSESSEMIIIEVLSCTKGPNIVAINAAIAIIVIWEDQDGSFT